MGFFFRSRKDAAARKAAASASLPAPPSYGGGSSYFTFSDIEKNTTASACVKFYEHAISILPLNLYERKADGSRRRADDHPLYTIVKRRPNWSESPVQFTAKMVRHIMEKGNAYLFKIRAGEDPAGKIVALRLLNPEKVKENYTGYSASYEYQNASFTPDQVLHIPSLITDDVGHGKAPLELAKTAITLGTDLDRAADSAFTNGIGSRLWIDLNAALKDCADEDAVQKRIRQYADYIARNYAGPDNAGKPLFTFGGMGEPKALASTSNREQELLESRKWQDLQICKAMGLPTWVVDGTFDVKYGGLEPAMILVLNFALLPYLKHIEQKFNTLLNAYEQERMYFEFDFSALLRTDEKSRAEYYSKLWGLGVVSPNQIANRENLDPLPEAGDTHFVPANNMPLTQDNVDGYMASAKAKAGVIADPSRATGDQAQ
jgi:HK97 family phage portal protein